MQLYKVDGRDRVCLAGLVDEGTEYFQAQKNDDGTITLSKVDVVTTAARRTSEQPETD